MLKKQKLLGIIICFGLLLVSLSIEFFNKDSNPERYKAWTEDSVLKAEDFLGKPPFYGGRQASISYRVRVITSPEIKVVTEMDKFRSYIKKNRISEKLIRHEAYHIKLAYAFLADVNKRILQQNLSIDEANQLTLRIYQRMEQYQKLYDKETNHSLIEAQQNYWEYKIDSIMNKSIHFPIFQEVENIEVYFPSRPKEFVLVLPDADFNGYKLEKYNMKFWIADLNMLTRDTSAIEDFWIYTIANEGHSNIVINRDYPYERSIFDSYSKDTVENEVVLDKLLLGKKSTYWLRTRYPIVEENEGVYKRKADQFFKSFKVLDE